MITFAYFEIFKGFFKNFENPKKKGPPFSMVVLVQIHTFGNTQLSKSRRKSNMM